MTQEVDKRIGARPKIVIRPGTLIRIQRDIPALVGVLGWYEQKQPIYDVQARVFECQELYGMYVGQWDHPNQKSVPTQWHEVMTDGKIYLFNDNQITNFVVSSSL
jgi:hypothetical protein